MKKLFALFALLVPGLAFAHDSTAPHVHPHASSMLPDYAAMLLAAALVAATVVAIRNRWRAK